ncbi:CBS domain-containing protein [Nocardioides sp.]|uniref:CBS domain-containing protein n=1 Tax=Nocardioides sp. TaxID=35761 RepID=UPI003516EEC6
MRIADVVARKSTAGVITIAPEAGVRALLALLAEHNIGAVVVSQDGTTLSGIVSERDVVRHLHHDGTVVNQTVAAIMTAEVSTCAPEDSLDDVLNSMTRGRFRHLPVVSGSSLVGLVSIGDIVAAKMAQLQFERDQLDSYVHQG